jgi:hypothetical protein
MNAVDTNLWIYCHDTRDPNKQLVAQHLIATLRPLALPWQVGCEFIAASRKLAQQGFDEPQAWSGLVNFLKCYHFGSCAFECGSVFGVGCVAA